MIAPVGLPPVPMDHARLDISIFGLTMGTTLAVIYVVARNGLPDNPLMPVLRVLTVSCWVTLAPTVADLRVSHILPAVSLLRTDAALILGALAAVVFGGFLGSARLPMAILLGGVTVAVMVLVVTTVARWWRSTAIGHRMLILSAGVAIGMWSGAVVWGTGYFDPLILEGLMTHRDVPIDTLYYASAAQMLNTHGVASIGVDGLAPIGTHLGQLLAVGGLAKLTAVPVLTFYQLGYPVIFLPLLFCSLAICSVHASRCLSEVAVREAVTGRPLFWLVLLIASTGVIPRQLIPGLLRGHNEIVSQSYSLALSLSALTLALVLAALRAEPHQRAKPLGYGLWSAVALLLVAIALTKVSLFILLMTAAGYTVLRLPSLRHPRTIACLTLCAAFGSAAAVAVSLTRIQSGYLQYSAFASLRNLWSLTWAWTHLLYSFWFIAVVVVSLIARRATTLARVGRALAQRHLVHLELVAVVAVAGLIPGLLARFSAGADLYFSDVQTWASVVCVLATLPLLRDSLHGRSKTRTMGRALSGLLLIVASGSAAYNVLIQSRFAIELNVRTRQNLAAWATDPRAASGGNIWNVNGVTGDFSVRSLATLPDMTDRSIGELREHKLVRALQALSERPLSERKRMLLYVPRSNEVYWGVVDKCATVPLIAPALTGIAMVSGLPSADCPMTAAPGDNPAGDYGYYQYDRSGDVASDPCDRARDLGFDEVVALEQQNGEQVIRNLLCRESRS